jgi:hypothetical protein
MPEFAPLTMPSMRMAAMGSLVGHLVYGVMLGALFTWLYYRARLRTPMRA